MIPPEILSLFTETEYDYRELETKLKQCNSMGWTFEYDLNGIPFDFRRIV